jgi:hypothetical protein
MENPGLLFNGLSIADKGSWILEKENNDGTSRLNLASVMHQGSSESFFGSWL